jgi:hypothetical protein
LLIKVIRSGAVARWYQTGTTEYYEYLFFPTAMARRGPALAVQQSSCQSYKMDGYVGGGRRSSGAAAAAAAAAAGTFAFSDGDSDCSSNTQPYE